MKSAFAGRRVLLLSDARFTTQRFLKGLPAELTLIGRVRKDAKLFSLPAQQPATGRRRCYGAPPTLEQIRQDPAHPWQEIQVHAAGADHTCRMKVVDPVLWRPAGARVLRLVVIAPLAYRPRKGSRIRYRDPAFLLCTDPSLPPEQIVQQYFRRWDIEVAGSRFQLVIYCWTTRNQSRPSHRRSVADRPFSIQSPSARPLGAVPILGCRFPDRTRMTTLGLNVQITDHTLGPIIFAHRAFPANLTANSRAGVLAQPSEWIS